MTAASTTTVRNSATTVLWQTERAEAFRQKARLAKERQQANMVGMGVHVHLSIYLAIYLSIYLSIQLSIYLLIPSIYLSIYLSIHRSIYPSI